MHRRYRSSISMLLRRGLFLLLLIPAHRYLNGLMPFWLPVALFLLAVLTRAALTRALPAPALPTRVLPAQAVPPRSTVQARVLPARSAMPSFAWAVVIPAAALLGMGVLWIAAVPLEVGGWWEQQFVLSRWHLLPAAILAEMATLWDRWAQRRGMGQTLFVPLMALAVVAIFWSQARFELSLFAHPSWYAVYAVLAVVGLICYQAVSGEARWGSRRGVVAGSLLLMALLLASGVAFRGWQTRAVEAGGGLLRPTAFQFDFADYISLEPEISLSRDLVFLYRESRAPRDRLLRRYVLSGYSPRRGFYRLDPADEPSPAPPLTVTEAADESMPTREGVPVDQEYYIVSLDPDALIAVNTPQQVTRIGNWSGSSFNSAYGVSSRHPDSDRATLVEAPWPRELPDRWREAYLQGPVSERIAALAREVTTGTAGYYETVDAVLSHLLSEYSYSLSPGEAVAGNQLEHFLFESRKGYCSYFAFSMTLMLRALEIPSRVAVGFFTDPDAAMLEFHPVRGDMAHAWVEVWFDGVGWVEFDPTSRRIAPGETVTTDYEIDQQRLSALVQEALSHGDGVVEGPARPGDTDGADGNTRRRGLVAGIIAAIVLLPPLWWHRRHRRWHALRRTDPRRAALLVVRRAGRCDRRDPESMTELEERARFAPEFSHMELHRLEALLAPRVTRSLRIIPPAVDINPLRGVGAVVGILAVLWVVVGGPSVTAQEELRLSADEVLRQAETAVEAENYDQALRRIDRGRELFPTDYRFPLLQGDIFFDQNVFSGARDAYRTALSDGAPNYSTRYALSRTLARLNEDQEAVNHLEALHHRYPDDLIVTGDLAWQYFKLHRLNDARRLLEAALEDVPDDRDLMMTLATIYSGLWEFAAAEQTYRNAISSAEHVNDRVFQAVAFYNLSILYANFHRFDQAFSAAERSLEAAERSSGYMIRGELRELELSSVAAASDYRRAAVLDEVSPLAELSTALLWVRAGYPRRAIARVDRITENDSGNWMYNYGTDPDRYQRQIYSAYAEGYEALAHQLRLQRPGSLWERAVQIGELLAAGSRAWYYRGMERRQRRMIADAYSEADRELLSRWNRMLAAEHRPRLALRHAAAAEAIETEFNPAARIEYRLFAAGITDDDEMLLQLLPELRGRWQRDNRATALRGIYRVRDTGGGALTAAADAWELAPGAMLINGLKIPIAAEMLDVPNFSRRQVLRILGRMGFLVVSDSPLVLEIDGGTDELRYRLYDRRTSRDLRRGSVRYSGHRADGRTAVEEISRILTREEEAVVLGGEL